MSFLQHVHGSGHKNGNVDQLLIPWPAAAQAGDAAILFWVGISSATWSNPTGVTFTQETSVDSSSGSMRNRIYSRVADDSESGDITLSHNGAFNRQTAILLVYRYTHPSDPVHLITTRDEGTSTTSHACPALTPTINGVTLVSFVAERLSSGSSGWTQATYTERADVAEVGSGGTSCAASDDGLNAVYRPGTAYTPPNWVSADAIATANVLTHTLALRPAIEQPIAKPRLVAQAVARAATW